jgi:hypothetical protein
MFKPTARVPATSQQHGPGVGTPEAGLVVLGAVVLLKVVWRGKTSAVTPKVLTAASAKASREEALVMIS